MTITPFNASIGFRKGRMSKATMAQQGFAAGLQEQMNDILKNYIGWVNHVDAETAEVLREALEPTFALSQELVPVEYGILKDSGYLETTHTKGKSSVEIGYARGGSPDYAVIVHEDLNKKHTPPTQAKYLQQPIEQDGLNIESRLIEGLKYAAGLGGGVTNPGSDI